MKRAFAQQRWGTLLGALAGIALLSGAVPEAALAAACSDCHVRTTALGGDVENWHYNDSIQSRINSDEWIVSGHGRTAGVYGGSGNPAAGFDGPVADPGGCAYCHDLSLAHNIGDNPLLLVNRGVLGLGDTAANGFGWNDVCQVCHREAGAGFDPDGAAVAYAARNAATKVQGNHYGAKHTVPTQGGTFCWDCHDPHGDAQHLMIQQKVVDVTDGAYGVPVSTRTVTGLDLMTGGYTSADLANASNTGLCQTCHAAGGVGALYYNRTSFMPFASHNGADTTVCTSCHTHGSAQTEFADLGVTLTDTPDPVVAGDNVTYTAVVRNWGPLPSTAGTLIQTLPAGVIYATATSTQGSCTVNLSTVTCDLGGLAAQTAITVTVQATTPLSGGLLSSTASVTGPELDPAPYNNNATATTTATLPNYPPTAFNDTYTTSEDTVLNVAAPGVLANDVDGEGDALSAVLGSGPAHGTMSLMVNGSFSYRPAPHFNGSDSFSYRASDGLATSNLATAMIMISSVNDAPTASAGPDQAGAVNQVLTFSGVGSTDIDGSIAGYSWNWGDGTPDGTGVTATHAYATPGIKTVTLTVTDNGGAAGSDTAAVTVSAVQTNLAWNKAAAASTTRSPSEAAAMAVDGSTSTSWMSSTTSGEQWVRVDLGASQSISNVKVFWPATYFAKAFRIETSTDGAAWTQRYSTTAGNGSATNAAFAAVSARFVRVVCTTRNNSAAYGIAELEVYATAPVNEALNKPAAASSTRTGTSYTPAKAVDGSTATSWMSSTTTGSQWVRVDLGSVVSISNIKVFWPSTYFAKAFQIETSVDGSAWTQRLVVATATGTATSVTFAAADARYVRVYCTTRNNKSYYAVAEVEVCR